MNEDSDYWNTKHAEASCYEHGEDSMWFDSVAGEWLCEECEDE